MLITTSPNTTHRQRRWLLPFAIVTTALSTPALALNSYYVDATNGSDTNSGISWAKSLKTLQKAVEKATKASDEIHIAKGTYTPTNKTDASDSRSATFSFSSNKVLIYGGYASKANSSGGRDRDPTTYPTILSGDLNGDDTYDTTTGMTSNTSDNAYHVIWVKDNNRGIALDGLTIQGGNANSRTYKGLGGGLYSGKSIVVINNCIFQFNSAEEGGGIYLWDNNSTSSDPTISNSTFRYNRAKRGGGAVMRVGGDAVVSNSTFNNNYASWRGGAVLIDYGSSPSFTSVTFSNNQTEGFGGGVYIDNMSTQISTGTKPTFNTCTFSSNSANYRGGGLALHDLADVTLTSCTLSNNTATQGGGAISGDESTDITLSSTTCSDNSATNGSANVDIDDTSTLTGSCG